MNKAWKNRERGGARAFNAERTIGSGSLGRADRTCSDTTHKTLFIEIKLRVKHTVVTLFDSVAALAKRERKVPVVMLAEKNRPGFWIMCKLEDLPYVASEYEKAQKEKRKQDLPGQTTFV